MTLIFLANTYFRTLSYLGSGHFGKVYKGLWSSPSGDDVEVAIKTLKEDAKEEERVKFLQEAAIMGQFKHSSIVSFYGVVTDQQPVSLAKAVVVEIDGEIAGTIYICVRGTKQVLDSRNWCGHF